MRWLVLWTAQSSGLLCEFQKVEIPGVRSWHRVLNLEQLTSRVKPISTHLQQKCPLINPDGPCTILTSRKAGSTTVKFALWITFQTTAQRTNSSLLTLITRKSSSPRYRSTKKCRSMTKAISQEPSSLMSSEHCDLKFVHQPRKWWKLPQMLRIRCHLRSTTASYHCRSAAASESRSLSSCQRSTNMVSVAKGRSDKERVLCWQFNGRESFLPTLRLLKELQKYLISL